MDSESDLLRHAARELLDAALLLAAYGESCAKHGTGQRDTMGNLVREVVTKADATRRALRATGS